MMKRMKRMKSTLDRRLVANIFRRHTKLYFPFCFPATFIHTLLFFYIAVWFYFKHHLRKLQQ